MICGILVPSVEVIIGFVGSTIGILICVLFPATCFIRIMQRNTGEKFIAQILIFVGIIFMVLGTYSNLMALDTSTSKNPVEVNQPVHITLDNQLPASVEKNLSEKISEDGIKKEELEMAVSALPPAVEVVAENKDVRAEMKEKDIEIKELKESKKQLEKEVLEIKEELVKQNKETQQLVLQKFDEIAEKVDKIQMDTKEVAKDEEIVKKDEKVDLPVEDAKKSIDNELNSVVDLLLSDKSQGPKEVENDDQKDPVMDKKDPVKDDKNPLNAESSEVLKTPEKSVKIDEEPQRQAVDPIVKHIVQKSQEPLSYQVGEKIMEEKKKNSTVVERSSNKTHSVDASHEEIKNEMRRKRDAVLEEEINLFGSDSLDVQMKSMLSLGRDLKAVDNEEI